MYIDNFLRNQLVKYFENRSTFAKVIIKDQVASFQETQLNNGRPTLHNIVQHRDSSVIILLLPPDSSQQVHPFCVQKSCRLIQSTNDSNCLRIKTTAIARYCIKSAAPQLQNIKSGHINTNQLQCSHRNNIPIIMPSLSKSYTGCSIITERPPLTRPVSLDHWNFAKVVINIQARSQGKLERSDDSPQR